MGVPGWARPLTWWAARRRDDAAGGRFEVALGAAEKVVGRRRFAHASRFPAFRSIRHAWMASGACSLAIRVRAALMLPPTESPATASREPSRFWTRPAGPPTSRPHVLLGGDRVAGPRETVVRGEDHGGVRADGEFTDQAFVSVGVAEAPVGAVDVEDHGQGFPRPLPREPLPVGLPDTVIYSSSTAGSAI